jgi:predicted MFS family arabinose efflux permease
LTDAIDQASKNWTPFEKYSTYLTVCMFTVLATINASNFTVAIKPISKEFHQTPTRTGFLVCFNVLFLGLGNLFWVALMRSTGKRPVYLVALLLLVATNVWSYEAKSYGSLLAARILSGFASAAADATVPSLVADLFFVHERGHCMMIFHLALSTGFFLGPLFCAYITQGVGWRWTCGMIACAAGGTFAVGFFTIRESNYSRSGVAANAPASAYPPKRNFISWLSLTRGFRKEESFVRNVANMIALVAYPPITWTGLTVGTFVGW